jgi:hypothetical protein
MRAVTLSLGGQRNLRACDCSEKPFPVRRQGGCFCSSQSSARRSCSDTSPQRILIGILQCPQAVRRSLET